MANAIKSGVATGDQVQEIFNYAKEKGFAIPAVNGARVLTIGINLHKTIVFAPYRL
jgi:hypothetical protein